MQPFVYKKKITVIYRTFVTVFLYSSTTLAVCATHNTNLLVKFSHGIQQYSAVASVTVEAPQLMCANYQYKCQSLQHIFEPPVNEAKTEHLYFLSNSVLIL